MPRTILAAILALPLAATVPAMAVAHHGWTWAEAEVSRLAGTVEAVSMAPPHPSLTVVDANGDRWTIELANPGATDRSGFTAGAAPQGSAIVIFGNRSADAGERRMKAVRITIDGDRTFDLYPSRIPDNLPQ